MTNLQAAVGVAQLKKIDTLINKRMQIALAYKRLLKQECPDLTLAPEMSWAKTVYWLYSVLVKKTARNKIIERMEAKGIETRPFFHPVHTLPPYRCGLTLPVAEELSEKGLNLPSGYTLSRSQIEYVTETLIASYSC